MISACCQCFAQEKLHVYTYPCRLCPHVVIVVGLERFSGLWGYAGRVTHTWPKVRDQIKRDTGVYTVRGGSMFTSGTRLINRRGRASEPMTANSGRLKKSKLESVQWEESNTGPTARAVGTVQTVSPAARLLLVAA